LPPLVVLYTLYARACDPVVSFLKDSALYQDEKSSIWCCAPVSMACGHADAAQHATPKKRRPQMRASFTANLDVFARQAGSKTRSTTWITPLLVNTSVPTRLWRGRSDR
jgi:hypothetical protein